MISKSTSMIRALSSAADADSGVARRLHSCMSTAVAMGMDSDRIADVILTELIRHLEHRCELQHTALLVWRDLVSGGIADASRYANNGG